MTLRDLTSKRDLPAPKVSEVAVVARHTKWVEVVVAMVASRGDGSTARARELRDSDGGSRSPKRVVLQGAGEEPSRKPEAAVRGRTPRSSQNPDGGIRPLQAAL